ncbi:MAG: hypothetical protein Q7R56_00345 [Nanoarchaeota archaeon]|nr:hypothetical protein [Nanoarchaeota archaeon]
MFWNKKVIETVPEDLTHIIVLGVSHMDITGPKLLQQALEQEQPAVITLEGDPAVYHYLTTTWKEDKEKKLQQLKEGGLQSPGYETLKQEYDMTGYECFTAMHYAQQHNLPIHFCGKQDLYGIQQGWQRDTRTMLSDGAVQALSNIQLEQQQARYRERMEDMETAMNNKPWNLLAELRFLEGEDYLFKEDETVAKNVLSHIQPGKKLVHITGALHILAGLNTGTLLNYLYKYKPTGTIISRRTVYSTHYQTKKLVEQPLLVGSGICTTNA